MELIEHFLDLRVNRSAVLLAALLGFSGDACGQSIPAAGSIVKTRSHVKTRSTVEQNTGGQLPNPIRQAVHTEPLTESSGFVGESSWGIGQDLPSGDFHQPPPHSHQILRAPRAPSGQPAGQHKTTGNFSKNRLVHPPYSSHRRRIQPEPATLPLGRERESWKSPYSYGYFGASGTRHWSLHHGYRDRYTEWRLK